MSFACCAARRLRGLVLGLLAGAIVASAASAAAPRRPNILIILADDLGYSDLGCYGSEIHTPTLDRLAADGLRFTQFYNTARCWPSRTALLTGFYAQQVRRDALPSLPGGGQGKRPAWSPLLPELLASAGYRSYHAGKWHIDGDRLAGGFAHSYSLEDHNHFFTPQNHLEDDVRLPPVEPTKPHYVTIGIADRAVSYLREHAQQHADQPFFLYLAFTAPHFPLKALPEDIARYEETYAVGWDTIRQRRHARQQSLGIVSTALSEREENVGPPYPFPDAIARLGPGEVNRPLAWSTLNETQRSFQAKKMAIHAAMVDRMDREIARVIEQVRAMNAWDDTLVMFMSDNGASAEIMVRGSGHDPAASPGSEATYLCLGPGWSNAANTPLRRHKTWVHEGGISTPLVVHWPKGITARGALRHDPTHLIDVVPTVLDVAGLKHPTAWQGTPVPTPPGTSLVPAFAADGAVQHADLWWLHEGNRAIRQGDWKLVAAKGDPWELYNLRVDRAESKNLANEQPDRVEQMAKLWQDRADAFGRQAYPDGPPPAPAKAKGKAKAKQLR